jgi:hypothetical protein
MVKTQDKSLNTTQILTSSSRNEVAPTLQESPGGSIAQEQQRLAQAQEISVDITLEGDYKANVDGNFISEVTLQLRALVNEVNRNYGSTIGSISLEVDTNTGQALVKVDGRPAGEATVLAPSLPGGNLPRAGGYLTNIKERILTVIQSN